MTNYYYSLTGKVTDPRTDQVAYIEVPKFQFKGNTLDLYPSGPTNMTYRMSSPHPQTELLQKISTVLYEYGHIEAQFVFDELELDKHPTHQQIYDALLKKL